MKRLVFLVEGNSEVVFINQFIIPYLYSLGFENVMHAQPIITNRKQHKKGGMVNYDHLKNDLNRVIAQGNVIITTLIDFFKLPPSFPNYTTDSQGISDIEQGVVDDFADFPDLIPYIQKYEFEALMFSKIDGFEIVMDDDKQLREIQDIMNKFPNPEDINNSPQTAPSKRLERIFAIGQERYEKVVHSELIFEMLDIQSILDKCPRFKMWIEKIIAKLKE